MVPKKPTPAWLVGLSLPVCWTLTPVTVGRPAVSFTLVPSVPMVLQRVPAASPLLLTAPSMVPLNMSGVQVAPSLTPAAASEETSTSRKMM